MGLQSLTTTLKCGVHKPLNAYTCFEEGNGYPKITPIGTWRLPMDNGLARINFSPPPHCHRQCLVKPNYPSSWFLTKTSYVLIFLPEFLSLLFAKSLYSSFLPSVSHPLSSSLHSPLSLLSCSIVQWPKG